MRTLITILFVMLCASARADFILSSGLGTGTGISSEQKLNGERVLNANSGGGLTLGIDWVAIPSVSFAITGGFQLRRGEVQYQNDEVTLNNLEASVSHFYLDEGIRWRFVNDQRFKVFVGGGLTFGYFSLVFDEDDFKKLNGGSKTGYEETEGKGQAGFYGETGAEYIFSNVSGVRLFVKYAKIHTGKFDNLGDKDLTLENTNINLQYIHYVDF